MRSKRFWFNTIFLTLFACSRETPAPPATASAPPPKPVITSTSAVSTAPPATALEGSYDEAMNWFRSAPTFHFALDEDGVHAEGDVTRKTIGTEVVQFKADGEEWRATAGPRGVTWDKRSGASWKSAAPPSYGNRVYQRVTLAFDPQKKEGSAQRVEANHYRFTNANTGEVHDVRVTNDHRIESINIGQSVELKIGQR